MGATASRNIKSEVSVSSQIDALITELNGIKTFKEIMDMIDAFQELYRVTRSLDNVDENYVLTDEGFGNMVRTRFKETYYYDVYDYDNPIRIDTGNDKIAYSKFHKHISFCCELFDKIHDKIEKISICTDEAVKSDIDKIRIIGSALWGIQSEIPKLIKIKGILYFIDQNTQRHYRIYNLNYVEMYKIFLLPSESVSLTMLLFKTDVPFLKALYDISILRNIIEDYDARISYIGWKDLFNTDEEIKKRDDMKIYKDGLIADMVAKIQGLDIEEYKGEITEKTKENIDYCNNILKDKDIYNKDRHPPLPISSEIEYLINKRKVGKMNPILQRYLNSAEHIERIINERIAQNRFITSRGGENLNRDVSYDDIDYEIYNKYKSSIPDKHIFERHLLVLKGERNKNLNNYIDSDLIYVIFCIKLLEELKPDEITSVINLELKQLKEDKEVIERIIKDLQSKQYLNNDIILEYYNTLEDKYKKIFKKYFSTYYTKIKPLLITMSGGGKYKMHSKKEILGKMRCIYKKAGDRKEYIKHKGIFITLRKFREYNKQKK